MRKQFIRSERSDLLDVEALAFRHLLIRDAAYGAMPKASRAEMHERFADWLEAELEDRIVEQQEIVGYHLERAHDLLGELGPSDVRQEGLAARAASHLHQAGRRAFDRGDMPAAVGLLERAGSLMPFGRPGARGCLDRRRSRGTRRRLASPWDGAPRRSGRDRRPSGRRRPVGPARLIHHDHAVVMTDAGWLDEQRQLAERLLAVAEPAGDDLGIGWAWYILGGLAWQRCRSDEAEPAWRRALEHLRRAGDQRTSEECFGWYVGVALLGPMPCDEALERLRGYEREVTGSVTAAWDLQATIAWVLAYQGHVDEARSIFRGYDRLLRELSRRETAAFATQMIGWVELIAGNFEEAERLAGVAAGELEAMGSEVGGVLWSIRAQALYELGRYDEAEAAANRSAERFSDLSTLVDAMLRPGDGSGAPRLVRGGGAG